ncbi:interferon a3-like [Acipenser ruthenus]|uniref:interferon a3-like n=1 Tax=Acipenser ruthenus TaxID=7906 RepID=UPI002741F522|nr:interferon a3-like [Acipenser ruthenus]
MDLRSLWKCIFVMVAVSQSFSLGCKWIQHRYKDVSRDSLQLITHMGKEFVMNEEHVENIPSPGGVYITNSQVSNISIIYKVLHHISKLYNGNMDSVRWDREKLDRFQSNLHTQTVHLKQCMDKEVIHSSGDHGKENQRIIHYFKKLENYLKRKKNSAHAWEIIRTQVWKHLQHLDLITASLRTPRNTSHV